MMRRTGAKKVVAAADDDADDADGAHREEEKENKKRIKNIIKNEIKSTFRNISTMTNLKDVCGPRVRFTSIDCNETRVILGANTGSIYTFQRTFVRDGSSNGCDDGGKKLYEGRMRFLAVVSPQSIKKLDQITGRTMVTSQVIQKVKMSPSGAMAAIAYASGVLHVISFTQGMGRDDVLKKMKLPQAGKTIALLRKAHAGQIITALKWSEDGNIVYCGDDNGMVTLTDVSKFAQFFETGDGKDVLKTNNNNNNNKDSNSNSSSGVQSIGNAGTIGGGGGGNSNNNGEMIEFEPVYAAKFVKCESLIPGLKEETEACHQIHCSKTNNSTLLSSRSKASVLAVKSGEQEVIGTKARDGYFGACFHEMCKSAIGLDEEENDVDNEKSKREWALCARPGRRLWITTVNVPDGDEAVPKVDVVATLRPDLPLPSAPIVLGYPENCFGIKNNPDRIKRMQKKFEFGTLMPLGDDNKMCLSVSQKAVAIVDVARATVAEWFPLREPETIAQGNFAAGFSDFAVSGRFVFFLTKASESANEIGDEQQATTTRGVGSTVWCLEVSSSGSHKDKKKDFQEFRELCKVDTTEQPIASSSSSVLVSGNAHVANGVEKEAVLAKLAKEVKPKAPPIEFLKKSDANAGSSDSEEVLYDEEVYPKIANASDVNAIFFYNPNGKSRKREDEDEKICAKAIVSGLLESEFNGYSADPELMALFESLDLLGLDPTRNYDQQKENTRASTGHAAAAMAMHEHNLLAEKNGSHENTNINVSSDGDTSKVPGQLLSKVRINDGSSGSGGILKSPINRLLKGGKNHSRMPETPRTPKTTNDVLTSHELLNVSRECCDPSSTRGDVALALQSVPAIAAKTIVIESSRALFVRIIQDVFSDDENIKALSKSLENLALAASEVIGADATLRCLKVACEDPDVKDHAEAAALDTPSGAMLSKVLTSISIVLIAEHRMRNSTTCTTTATTTSED